MLFAIDLKRTVEVCRDRTKLLRNVLLAIVVERMGSRCTGVKG